VGEGPMTSIHLDLETYQRLRSGQLDPARARQIAAHLDGDCATCDAFLAAQPADDLDGATDAALVQLAPPAAEERGNDIEYAKIRRVMSGKRAPTWRVTRFAAIAAALLAVGGASLVGVRYEQAKRADEAGVKGFPGRPTTIVPAKLLFAVVEPSGAGPKIDHGRSGEVVPEGASLAFRVEVGRPAYVALLRVGGAENEVVWKQHVDRAGSVDISENGRPAMYSLRGLAGTQRFVLVASERPIADEDLGAAARAANGASASREDPRFNVMTLDVVEVTVR
jgi:hypothetical protein